MASISGHQLTQSAVAATAPFQSSWICRVFFQNGLGEVHEADHLDGTWSKTGPCFSARPFSPLAAISWNDGKNVRVYSITEDQRLQEWCQDNKGKWYRGGLSNLKVPATPLTSIAAVYWVGLDNGPRIRVYLQEDTSGKIQEYSFDTNQWYKDQTLANAAVASSLAAVVWLDGDKKEHIRIYYQDSNLRLREHCHDARGKWYDGQFHTGPVPRRSAIAAYNVSASNSRLRVYFQDDHNALQVAEYNGGWKLNNLPPVLALPHGTSLAAIEWTKGKHSRVYYRSVADDILETCEDKDGEWFKGDLNIQEA